MPDKRRHELKGALKILNRAIVSFEDLIAPLSKGKVLLLIECLNVEECEQPELMTDLSELLDLGFGPGFDDWDDFLGFGFLVMEGEIKPENETEAALVLDYLRNEKFRDVIQADLFVDGALQDSSWNGEPELWDMATQKPKDGKSVVIRFPIEKINRHKDPGVKK
jgi:hypothetical protein